MMDQIYHNKTDLNSNNQVNSNKLLSDDTQKYFYH